MGKEDRRHWECLQEWVGKQEAKRAREVKVRSLTHTALIPGYPSLSLLYHFGALRLLNPALESAETTAETTSERRRAAEIECHVNVLENWNKLYPCS